MLRTGVILLSVWLSLATASPLQSPAEYISLFGRDSSISSGCSTSGAASCHNTSSVNTCCFESPGGLLLQTQFWDTSPSTGPTDSWTIHGLWPDNCDGTFDENCDPSRDYTGISSLLTAQGASSTLSFMQTHWVDINGQNEQFWEVEKHEWSTHGTCMSTLRPSCLSSGNPKGAEAVAFFQTVVKLFQVRASLYGMGRKLTQTEQTLPTYDWLSKAGILPSTKTFTLSTLTSALKSASGVTPALDCNGSTLNAISWYFNLKGSIIDGVFVPINAPKAGSCPSSGIKYPPKSGSGSPTVSSVANQPSPTGTSGSLPARATINAIRSGSSVGGLLSLGTWSTQTLATFSLSGTASTFTMTSSKGNCGVSGGAFSCGSGVSSTKFSAVSSGGSLLLASGGSTSFSSDGVPGGTTVYEVFTGSSHSQDYTLEIVGI
ncbi:Ribonuclease Le2 [Leucoagaricus sp. SymC.cos]|nr:Ribonuclease Le2 [Leucoagaricus sp. SymC.cos]